MQCILIQCMHYSIPETLLCQCALMCTNVAHTCFRHDATGMIHDRLKHDAIVGSPTTPGHDGPLVDPYHKGLCIHACHLNEGSTRGALFCWGLIVDVVACETGGREACEDSSQLQNAEWIILTSLCVLHMCVEVCGGVCVWRHACVCGGVREGACVWRHQDGGVKATRALDDSNFGAISRGGGAFAADGLSSTHRHTLEPAMLLPVGSKRCFCRGFVPGYIHRRPATFTPRWTPPVNTTLSPHPLGSLELAAGPHRHHGHKWLRLIPCGPSGAPDGNFFGQGAQQPLTPGLSGVGLASPPIW